MKPLAFSAKKCRKRGRVPRTSNNRIIKGKVVSEAGKAIPALPRQGREPEKNHGTPVVCRRGGKPDGTIVKRNLRPRFQAGPLEPLPYHQGRRAVLFGHGLERCLVVCNRNAAVYAHGVVGHDAAGHVQAAPSAAYGKGTQDVY